MVIRKLLIISVVVFIYIWLRIPALSIFPEGEDGLFASIPLDHPKNPLICLYGREQDKNRYMLMEHPTLMHQTVSLVGKTGQYFIDTNKLTFEQKVLFVRAIYLSFSVLGFAIILIAISVKNSILHVIKASVMLLTLFSLAFVLIDSVDMQMDTSVGFLITAIYVATVMLREKVSDTLHFKLVTISSLLFGLFKNEWAVIFITSEIFYGLLNKENIKRSIISIIFVILGSLLSYLYDPINFIAGWKLMVSLGSNQTIVGSLEIKEWLFIMYQNFYYLYFYFISLLMLALYIFGKRKQLHNNFLQLFILSFLLFLPFIISNKLYHSRFFAPSFVAISGSMYLLSKQYFHQVTLKKAIPFLLIVIAFSQFQVFAHKLKLSNRWSENVSKMQNREDCLERMSTAQGYFLGINFISDGLNPEYAQTLVNAPICPD